MRVGMAISSPFARSPRKGAQTLIWLVDSEEAGAFNGGYFADLHQLAPSVAAQQIETAQRLWQVSEQQTGATALGRS
jgi:hypothetical protein